MWPLGYVFNTFQWPIFHTWGLTHGSLLVAWPSLGWVTNLCLKKTRWFSADPVDSDLR
jgi:hypothetical protein